MAQSSTSWLSDRTTTLVDGFLSDWRARRDQLSDAPLASEEWPSVTNRANNGDST